MYGKTAPIRMNQNVCLCVMDADLGLFAGDDDDDDDGNVIKFKVKSFLMPFRSLLRIATNKTKYDVQMAAKQQRESRIITIRTTTATSASTKNKA